jgi:hypothetical protein
MGAWILVGGRKWSTIVGMGLDYFWVAGWLSLALLAYFIRYYHWGIIK